MGKKRLCISDKIVSWYMYGMAYFLVIFMVAIFINGAFSFFVNLWDILDLYRNIIDHDNAKKLLEIENSILHFISFSIVMVKAYKILISYALHHHISTKYIVEISIIASAVEILFNSHAYEIYTLIIFGIFGITNLLIYLIFYDRFKNID